MMGKILFILLLMVFCGDLGLANYPAWKEGDDAYLLFSLSNETTLIKKNNVGILDLEGNRSEILNPSYKERIIFDKEWWKSRGPFNFTILNVTSSDAGMYECWNNHLIEKSSQLLVVARKPSEPKIVCVSGPPVVGNEVTLSCHSSSRSLPQNHSLIMKYRWRKNDEKQNADDRNLTFTVRRSDKGDNYSCQAFEGGLDSQWSSNFTLQPQYGPDSIRITPTSVLEGDNVTCSADCNPVCNITVSGGDGQVITDQVPFSIDRGQSEINCKAWNVHGHKSKSCDVKVLFPPELSFEDGNKTTHEGSSISVTGLVVSNPEPRVTIHSPIGTGVHMTSLEGIGDNNYNISYTIDSAKCDDHGLYQVTAEHPYGSTNSSVAVMVLCSPRHFHNLKPVKTPDDNTWSFMIQAYPEPTLQGIFSILPGRDTKAINLSHNRIPAELQTDGLKTQNNLYEFHVNFPCEPLGEEYLLTFINTVGKKNISFSLEEDRCEAPTDATVVITVVIVTMIMFLILLSSGLVIYRRRKMAETRRYRPHGTCNTTRNNIFRQEYATVPRKMERPVKDVYAKVKREKGKPIICKNKMYDGARNLSGCEALIVGRASLNGEGADNNCGERNEDGLIYADLDLLPPTLNNGSPVIKGTREETVYVDIDFTKTPGPQLPDKIWEVEKM